MSFPLLHRWFGRADKAPAPASVAPPAPTEAQAQFLKGLQFATGAGVAQDFAQAAQWYTQAAAQNHSLAQLNLAGLYRQGQGVARDEAKALLWLTKAARLGNALAQYRLGIQYHLLARKVSAPAAAEDRIEGLKWTQLSATQGCREAEGASEFMALGMTRQEVAEGRRRVAAFVAGSPA